MTATPATVLGWASTETGAMTRIVRGLVALAQAGKGQFVTVSPSTGFAALNDGTVPGQICGGTADPSELSDVASVDGAARIRLTTAFGYGRVNSTISNDAILDSDFGVPFWIAKEATIGKLSNSGGSNRSLGGLAFGLSDIDNTPFVWDGPIAWLLARATLIAQSKLRAWHSFADAAAGTATAEVPTNGEKLHGTVTAIEFTGDAITASDTDNAVITVSKRDGAGGAAVVLGTMSTAVTGGAAVVAFTPRAFTLSVVAGALNLLETDVVTVTSTKAGAGKVLRGSVRVVAQVL